MNITNKRIESISLIINVNLEALGDQQEFVLDWINENTGYNFNYYDIFESYLKKFDLEGVILDEDRTYYQSMFSFRFNDFSDIDLLLEVVERFTKILERKYHLESFRNFYNKVQNHKTNIKGYHRDCFEIKAFSMYRRKFIRF